MKDEVEKLLDEIYERMNDFTIFHDRNDGDFKDYGETYMSWSEAKTALLALIHKAQVEAVRAELKWWDELINWEKPTFDTATKIYLNAILADRLANLKEDGETK